MRHTKAKTKTEAVNLAVADFNRRQRLARLAAQMGTFKDLMTRDELRRMRETDWNAPDWSLELGGGAAGAV